MRNLYPFNGGGGGFNNRPSGPHLPRKRLSEERFIAKVTEWKGKYGWVLLEDRGASTRQHQAQGRIYVSVIDLIGCDRLNPGELVEFFLFEDESGLGGEEVRILRGATNANGDALSDLVAQHGLPHQAP